MIINKATFTELGNRCTLVIVFNKHYSQSFTSTSLNKCLQDFGNWFKKNQ